MVRYFYCLLLILFCLFNFSCTPVPTELKTAEQLMETAPDSSLHILQKLKSTNIYGRYNCALYALLMIQALDKTDSIIENDSLIAIATNYFDDNNSQKAGYAVVYQIWRYMDNNL